MPVLFAILFAAVYAGPLVPPSTGWIPSYTTQLGVTFDAPPAAGAAFERVTGTVSDPEVLALLGLPDTGKGEPVVVTPFYAADFSLTADGKRFVPAIIKIAAGDRLAIVGPRRGSDTPVSLARGDRNAKPGGNGWMPSWTTQLGIAFESEPAAGSAFGSLAGRVAAPETLQQLGFPPTAEGASITLAQDDPLQLDGSWKTIVRLTTDSFFEVFVVESETKLVPVSNYLKG